MMPTQASEGGAEPRDEQVCLADKPRRVTLAKVIADYATAIGRSVRLVKRKGRMELVVEAKSEQGEDAQ